MLKINIRNSRKFGSYTTEAFSSFFFTKFISFEQIGNSKKIYQNFFGKLEANFLRIDKSNRFFAHRKESFPVPNLYSPYSYSLQKKRNGNIQLIEIEPKVYIPLNLLASISVLNEFIYYRFKASIIETEYFSTSYKYNSPKTDIGGRRILYTPLFSYQAVIIQHRLGLHF